MNMNIPFYIFFTCIALSNILFWVSLWQLKEYRWDRFSVHLKDTQQGIRAIFSFDVLLPVFGIVIFIVSIFSDIIAKYFPFVALAIFLILFSLIVRKIARKRLKKPVLTVKAIGITVISLLILFLLALFSLTDLSVWLLLLLLITPFIVGFSVFLFAFPTEIYTDIYVQKAKEKRRKFPKLRVIAVSGSYGKSSTKEVIAQILSKKYQVVKTSFSNNTPLAIAKTILSDITKHTDFFVVELGAYKKGEIRQLAEMVGPTISVTTAISDQHLALYGSMQEVIDSEMELIHELPKNSLVLLNGNSEGILKMAEKIKHQNILWYQVAKRRGDRSDVTAHIIQTTAHGVVWMYKEKSFALKISSPLLGEHTVENILPGIILARHFGYSARDIQNAIATLSPLPKTMEMVILRSGVTAIDDTFNASPESVLSSLEYLKLFPKRKLYVLSPLIELGKMGKIRHQEIGQKLAGVDYLFLTNKNYLSDITLGMREKNGKTRIIVGSYTFLARKIKETLKKGDAIIFEGKEAGIVLKQLL